MTPPGLFLSKNGELYTENRKVVSRNFLVELFRREENIVLAIHVEVARLPGAESVTFGNDTQAPEPKERQK